MDDSDRRQLKGRLNQLSQSRDEAQSVRVNKTATKSQLNRLKKFYYTTKWLPNSAFTTYFGKPAFENYGYGNVHPANGGLFYGNYMLSHNINPIDGRNIPDSKQVYSSAMLKALKGNKKRMPQPPRKTPDEIRNTPAELEEIRGRNPIFQLKNEFPEREIKVPNLLNSRYFKSAKNTPKQKRKEPNEEELDDEFDIGLVLDNKIKAKPTTAKTQARKSKMPKKSMFEKPKPILERNRTKPKQSLKPEDMNDYQDMMDGEIDMGQMTEEDREEIERAMMEEYLEKVRTVNAGNKGRPSSALVEKKSILGGEKLPSEKQVLTQLQEQQRQLQLQQQQQYQQQQLQQQVQQQQPIIKKDTKFSPYQESDHNQPKGESPNESKLDRSNLNNVSNCVQCGSAQYLDAKARRHKKDNPCLVEPSEVAHNYICCIHNSNEKLTVQEKDPKNYKHMPPCTLNKIAAAGKPVKMSEPLGNLLRR